MTLAVRILAAAVLLIIVGAMSVQLFRGKTGREYYQLVGADSSVEKLSISRADYEERVTAINEDSTLSKAEKAAALQGFEQTTFFSMPRTLGMWLAALFTLAIMSFLYADNPAYRIAEHAYVGVSAGYGMMQTMWQVAVPFVLTKLCPQVVKAWFSPALNLDEITKNLAMRSWLAPWVGYEKSMGQGVAIPWYHLMDYWYLIPTIMGVMLAWRLMPKGGWISRWPLAFFVGSAAGMRLPAFLGGDFVAQIKATLVPIIDPQYVVQGDHAVLDLGQTFYASMDNILLFFGTFCVLIYFFFSFEHKGVVGRVSRIGIWVLMISFGAGFGYTVMARIALLRGRFEFLLRDWLGVI